MVLKDSKWDKKAKYKYMKKHGLSSKPAETSKVTPRWTSKKTPGREHNRVDLKDSDDEWDSDVDEALINHFYPSLQAGEALSMEHKLKIKEQILRELGKEEEEGEAEEPKLDKERDGIYLGTEENEAAAARTATAKFNLEEFISSVERKPAKSKKLLKNKISDNFLEEYGLDSYHYKKNTRCDDDFLEKRSHVRDKDILSRLNFGDFDEYEIGKGLHAPKEATSRSLTAAEREEEEKRQRLVREDTFYREIKRRFGDKAEARPKVLDLNNFDAGDANQLDRLRARIERGEDAKDDEERQYLLDEDIDVLLAGSMGKLGVDVPEPELELEPEQQRQLLAGCSMGQFGVEVPEPAPLHRRTSAAADTKSDNKPSRTDKTDKTDVETSFIDGLLD
ncbi:uncharacterized protein LODBEIA_P48980 [Lodderomyces beijingensis]|uniref:Uncharacterized protein n=1 Tax=Lodderomyces beijingensis TaxID=1775926 RepID=A0ABP0ZRB1_9ASCO